MIDKRTIFEIHRLANEGLSVRKITKILGVSRKSVCRYLKDPTLKRSHVTKMSKLDPFKDQIRSLLEADLRQRLRQRGYQGGITILRDYLRAVRPASRKRRPFIRFESAPGQQCQVDWGHFGSLAYGATRRKLYCLAVIECHSRMLYIEFTHSMRQETLHRCLLNAFRFFQGTPKELVHDNMLTAVLEREGPLVRFNEAFLEFLRPFKITPVACTLWPNPTRRARWKRGPSIPSATISGPCHPSGTFMIFRPRRSSGGIRWPM